ncbi:unnamed protein product [Lathyrus oleraceus]|uniref:Core-2/I-branching beta-1,6-N-acetylglucosaminyltransferase family protein n=1 Tax=Pisum sativum TaxID=3888 RepID=A0A9D4VZY4_PEA|nr:glycosyltransferase BC10 [Pisum sativum]KAI5393449.1 hypothetical protein KIW84_060543 [Pisum sativum]
MQSRVVASEEGKSKGLSLGSMRLFVVFIALCVVFSVISIYTIKHFGIKSVVTTMSSTLQPCVEEHGGLEQWIKPPSNLIHNMSDSELLWRASLVPKVKRYPFRRVPKIAFMFLTKGPLPLAPLWERFLKGHQRLFTVYIHPFPSYQAHFPPSSAFYKRQIPSQIAAWGKMSMCDAERRLVANALLDISNEWFILLSESCIPLYKFSTVYNYLLKSKFSFVGAFDDPGPYGRGRYNPNMAPLVDITKWRKGSQWFEVNRKLAVSIVEDTAFYPKFEQYCRPACYVDEHYFPTMLTIQAGGALANRSITWVDWSRGGAHPATFGKSDITKEFFDRVLGDQKCIYNNRNSSVCVLFARKFAPSALEPLLEMVNSKVLDF